MTGPTLQELGDRREIEDVLIRYAMSLDARDWAALEDVFLPDAEAQLGDRLHCEDRDAIIATCRTALSGLTVSQHIIGNFTVELDGDRATSRCYLHAQHCYLPAVGLTTFIVAGTYHDRLVRTEAGWRIAHRVLEQTWVDGNAGLMDQAEAAWAAQNRAE
jgi:3-phenylpropionate/cinnamic acid dioxygenase small subunit